MKKCKENECPKCGTKDIEIVDGFHDEGGFCTQAWCEICQIGFDMWYNLVYDTTIIDDGKK